MYFKRLAFISAGILLIAPQGTELSSDVFIVSIGLVVAKISPVEDEEHGELYAHLYGR